MRFSATAKYGEFNSKYCSHSDLMRRFEIQREFTEIALTCSKIKPTLMEFNPSITMENSNRHTAHTQF